MRLDNDVIMTSLNGWPLHGRFNVGSQVMMSMAFSSFVPILVSSFLSNVDKKKVIITLVNIFR